MTINYRGLLGQYTVSLVGFRGEIAHAAEVTVANGATLLPIIRPSLAPCLIISLGNPKIRMHHDTRRTQGNSSKRVDMIQSLIVNPSILCNDSNASDNPAAIQVSNM